MHVLVDIFRRSVYRETSVRALCRDSGSDSQTLASKTSPLYQMRWAPSHVRSPHAERDDVMSSAEHMRELLFDRLCAPPVIPISPVAVAVLCT